MVYYYWLFNHFVFIVATMFHAIYKHTYNIAHFIECGVHIRCIVDNNIPTQRQDKRYITRFDNDILCIFVMHKSL